LQQLSARWTDDQDRQLLQQADQQLDELRDIQDKIEQVAHTPANEPAQLLLTREITPLSDKIFAACTEMIELEKEFPSGSHRRMLLAAMADFRA
ncbi:MAG: hypothetical protein GTO03_02945, partial [Planctomycetales bacterium]|nr:hypothetical protein [Planctomycetales bacterium]